MARSRAARWPPTHGPPLGRFYFVSQNGERAETATKKKGLYRPVLAPGEEHAREAGVDGRPQTERHRQNLEDDFQRRADRGLIGISARV